MLTTRELARLIKLHGIDLNQLTPEAADIPFGSRSTAGKLFGASGGVTQGPYKPEYYRY